MSRALATDDWWMLDDHLVNVIDAGLPLPPRTPQISDNQTKDIGDEQGDNDTQCH